MSLGVIFPYLLLFSAKKLLETNLYMIILFIETHLYNVLLILLIFSVMCYYLESCRSWINKTNKSIITAHILLIYSGLAIFANCTIVYETV